MTWTDELWAVIGTGRDLQGTAQRLDAAEWDDIGISADVAKEMQSVLRQQVDDRAALIRALYHLTLGGEMRKQIQEDCARSAWQKGELEKVKIWRWQRMMPRPGQKRRVKETVEVSLHPSTGWVTNISDETCKPCSSISEHYWGGVGEEQWRANHEGVPTVWRVSVRSSWDGGRRTWCENCLPDEFRPSADIGPDPYGGDPQPTAPWSGETFGIAGW